MRNSITVLIVLALPMFMTVSSRAQVCSVAESATSHCLMHTPKPSYGDIEIPVAFHVIYASDGTGNLADSELDAQLETLNTSFQNTRFSFRLAFVSRTMNNDWFDLPSAVIPDAIRSALAIDPTHVMNVYIGDMPDAGDFYGWATLPADHSESDTKHGVMVDYVSLPGGPPDPLGSFDAGDTMVHEVGHYLGLLHPFGDLCSSDADGLGDTPICLRPPVFGSCDAGQDTCTGQPFRDPISNWMNYTSDECRTQFTLDQEGCMDIEVDVHRPNLDGPVVDHSSQGDLIVEAGSSQKIEAGMTVKFAPGKKLKVDGSLTVAGTTGEPVTLTGNNSWGGIQFNSGSSGSIDYATLSGITWSGASAVKIVGSSPTVTNSTISTGGRAFTITGSQANPTIQDNTISSTWYAFHLSSSAKAKIYRNSVTGNGTAAAVATSSYADATLVQSAEDGLNEMSGYYNGLYAETASVQRANYGWNCIESITSYDLFAMDWSTIYGMYNYWGGGNPSVFVDEESTVQWSPKLSSDPCTSAKRELNKFSTVEPRLDDRISALLSLIEEDPTSLDAGHATIELGRLCKEGGESVQGLIDAIALAGQVPEVFRLGSRMICHENLGETDDAIGVANEIAATFASTPLEFIGTFGVYQLNRDTGRISDAAAALSNVRTYTDLQREEVELEADEMAEVFGKRADVEGATTALEPTVETYPNPFNPSTTIRYVVREDSRVRLSVFDVLGREVRPLVDEDQESGRYRVVFDASNLATGVYIWQFVAGSVVQSGSVVLLK